MSERLSEGSGLCWCVERSEREKEGGEEGRGWRGGGRKRDREGKRLFT